MCSACAHIPGEGAEEKSCAAIEKGAPIHEVIRSTYGGTDQ
jgi:hypothetical protein